MPRTFSWLSATAPTATARSTPASRYHRPAGAHRDSTLRRPRNWSATATNANAGMTTGARKMHAASHLPPERPGFVLSRAIRTARATR
ncbi:MAG: hypothetical protein ACYCO9_09935 [Streptosporangiaceae bacterium]